MNVEFVLEHTLKKLSRKGSWCKGRVTGWPIPGLGWDRRELAGACEPVPPRRKPKAYDLMGALAFVGRVRGYPWPVAPYVLRAIRERTGTAMTMTEFNDDRRTNVEDVKAVLQRALELAKAGKVCNDMMG